MVSDRPSGKPFPIEVIEESLYEVRRSIYPRAVSGLFAKWRWILVFATQLLFYGLPWLRWNDRQAVLFDLVGRKFYIFGLVLWPQDIIYLTLLLILCAFALFLFTAIAGRLFCGYACPQTVYTEIFMWLERLVEGDRFARIRLDAQAWSWNFNKWRLKLIKHSLWLLVAFLTGATFIGYFTPIDTLGAQIVNLTLGPWQLFWLGFYSFATWGNAGFMREQVCKYMCPYARFQSVMVDKDTFLVTYDTGRGEPRGRRNKADDQLTLGLGDCIDCSICVQVCPTGIDIRDGLQYMCIGCGACIDACNQVMDKVEYPRGLIRYTTERAIEEKTSNQSAMTHILRPRVLIYSALITLLASAFLISLVMRNPLRVDIMRDRGSLAREVGGERIENIYRMQLMNASEHPLRVELKITGLEHLTLLNPQGQELLSVMVPPSSNQLIPVKVSAQMDDHLPGNYPIYFEIKAQQLSHNFTHDLSYDLSHELDHESSHEAVIQRTHHEKSTFIIPR